MPTFFVHYSVILFKFYAQVVLSLYIYIYIIHFYFLILKEQLEYANIFCPLFCDPIQVLYIYIYMYLACSSFKTNVP